MNIAVYDRMEPLATEWDALADAVGAPPWLRPGWFEVNAATPYRVLARPLDRSLYVELDEGWGAYEARLGRKMLSELRRRRRRLAEEGELAFEFSEGGGAHALLKTRFDPAYGRWAPGMLLRREMLRRAFGAGLRSYDFLGDDEP